MPCDTRAWPNQTLTERKVEVKTAIERLDNALSLGTVKLVVGPQGAVTFKGWTEGNTSRVTDACAYRRLLASSSPNLRKAVARAEAMAGRKIDAKAIAIGEHSHDGGHTWGKH